ncbi:MAG: DAK2 domain-containing protein, partial [Chloroflexi bacterium]|nr:DAK2 domain-containing protein [Chloroflexota bacterium]
MAKPPTTTVKTSTSARPLLDLIEGGAAALQAEVAVINGLNVFPVPDGDTGTNMLATVEEALARAAGAATLPDAAAQLAEGAMLGARGNSGVILAQLFQASAEVLKGQSRLGPGQLRAIFERARVLAYESVDQPAEGTLLSVIAAIAAAGPEMTLEDQLLRAIDAAEQAVSRTPEQLATLREAGVVDSGGYGLMVLLRGCYERLSGASAPPIGHLLVGVDRVRGEISKGGVAHPATRVDGHPEGYGSCLTLLVECVQPDAALIRRRLAQAGSSVLVATAAGQVKLHVHTDNPKGVIALAAQWGRIVRHELSDIDEQVQAAVTALPIVAVAPGAGLVRVFKGLGATVVRGGQGQNPSTAALLEACDRVLANSPVVFLL